MKKISEMLSPRTIAIIGASQNKGKVGNILAEKSLKFNGETFFVNPKHEFIIGKKTYSSVITCPKKIELAVIAIPSEGVKKVLEECGKKKIKNVIIISAGFSEAGNTKQEEEIIKIAKKFNISFLGPNCFGIANPYINLDLTFSNKSPKKGDIAFISQSGALGSYVFDICESKNFGFSGFVSLGNMAGLNFNDFIKYFDEDNKTKKIILYIEKLKQGREFIQLCKKSKKEIIAVKAGQTKKGNEATISHTGSLATDSRIYRGAFKQAGVKQVDSLGEAFGIRKTEIKINRKKIIIVTNAGGAGALLTDFFTKQKIKVLKIIDILGTASAKDYERAFKRLKDEKNYDSVVAVLTPQSMSEPEKTAHAVVEFSKSKPVTAFFLGGSSIKKARQILEQNNIRCVTKI